MIIEQQVHNLIKKAISLQATDIHIVPKEKTSKIFFRLQHILRFIQDLSHEDSSRLIAHFKFMAGLDIGEKRKPQSGAYTTVLEDLQVSLRLSTLPTSFSESLSIRILPQEAAIPIEQIALFPSTAKKLISLLKHAHGLILFTGPTGSGKSTTLYTLLKHSSQWLKRNIISLEDPIEKTSSDFLQVQVNEKAGVSYASGLKAILRHDPDVIVVGEIRDEETAKVAVRAALTGHLVLTTMHTRNAKGAVTRLLELGVKDYEVEQALIAVTAQRLIHVKCPYCGRDCSIHCPFYNRQRACIFELLAGKELQKIVIEVKKHCDVHYRTLKEELKKGMALGFIDEEEFNRWVFSVE
ncbi:competence type IV pilus ATPase ComGA [Bacillus litorisediminis]|uniref:competence type IV pilus ATPase ComGA n=1 Tax=Bacillus litorisediminis TaxID=2922713 RepID=UPI001FAE0015|nr:competence type IV pilus ATPase ComGA [Bacillus litorisediminis]